MGRLYRFVMGVALIVGGIMFIPYFKQILDVLIDLIDTMFPALPDTAAFVVHSMPWFVLIMIFVSGGWMVISSLMGSNKGEPE